MTQSLQDVQRQIDWLCDAMIPGDPDLGFPSARDVDVQNTLLPAALGTRPDLAPDFLALVARFPRDCPPDPLALVNAASEDERALLGRFIAGAYLMSPQVTERLGYPGFQELPLDPDYDEIMAAVEPIVERGPIYREV
ncbi:MAG: hypothetical protein ACK5JR_17335 [Tropicimonas sp.]|uniref:hypothetical protein n=1 Tax=Tropicimonas sp. TaxID=2067044 RepID=UPI003A89BFAF